MGVNQTATNFEAPRTTLRDHLSGAWSPDPYLTKKEEQDLADFLKQATRIGYGKTKKELLLLFPSLVSLSHHPTASVLLEGNC